MDFEFINRHIRRHVVQALADTRVVVLLGARQVGKSTLAEQIATHEHPASILTHDDRASRAAAERDPTGFAADLETPVVIDEVQRAPDLLLAIKQRVDVDRRPGQFLLTGWANLLTAPTIADALTGRAAHYRMWPFTQGEMRGVREPFIEMMFENEHLRLTGAPVGSRYVIPMLLAGGYPEAQACSAISQASREATTKRTCEGFWKRSRPCQTRCSAMAGSADALTYRRARCAHTPTCWRRCSSCAGSRHGSPTASAGS